MMQNNDFEKSGGLAGLFYIVRLNADSLIATGAVGLCLALGAVLATRIVA